MKNLQNLTINILAHDRPIQISKLIYQIFDLSKKYKFKIRISDDSTTNFCKDYCKDLNKFNKNFTYIKNIKTKGHDGNYVDAFRNCKTDFLWVVSDSSSINEKIFQKLTLLLNKKNDLIIVGAINRDFFLNQNLDLSNKNSILENLAWYLTLTGSFILSKKIFSINSLIDFNKFQNFPHLGLIFTAINTEKVKIKKIKYPQISSFAKKSYWVKNIYKVFLNDFPLAIKNLPGYSKESAAIAIINHSKYSKLFNFKNLLYLKSVKLYNLNIFNLYKERFKKFTNYNFFNHFLTLIIPLIAIKFFIYINRKIKL